MIKDTNWGLESPKLVKTTRKHHKYPLKVSPNTFGNFFLGDFSPQIAPKRLSPTGRLLGISPTASARVNRYFGHKSGSGAQNLDFLAHRLRNHHAQLLGRRKIWPKRPLRGPRSDFLGFLAVLRSPKKTQVPGPPNSPKTQKIGNSAKMGPFHRKFSVRTL